MNVIHGHLIAHNSIIAVEASLLKLGYITIREFSLKSQKINNSYSIILTVVFDPRYL